MQENILEVNWRQLNLNDSTGLFILKIFTRRGLQEFTGFRWHLGWLWRWSCPSGYITMHQTCQTKFRISHQCVVILNLVRCTAILLLNIALSSLHLLPSRCPYWACCSVRSITRLASARSSLGLAYSIDIEGAAW